MRSPLPLLLELQSSLEISNLHSCSVLASGLLPPRRMPKLPNTRQTLPAAAAARKRTEHQRSLAHAFRTFARAAGSLEQSYAQLQSEVARLRLDLEHANAELSRSLAETSRVRVFLGRVLEELPCGVLVTGEGDVPRLANPEARRLLDLDPNWNPGQAGSVPPILEVLFSEVSPEAAPLEREWAPACLASPKILGVSATRVEKTLDASPETVWILRDISDQKRLAAERESARRAHALAEIAAVLAHEIRNPLGSMELFAGLLAAATAEMPDASQWVVHLQAGLRSLSATVSNVLQFHTQAPGQFFPTDLGRLLRETIEFLQPLARQRRVTVEFLNSWPDAHVAADPHLLRQLFFNLALNAFQAMPDGGSLLISLCPTVSGQAQMDFADNGPGIAPAALDKILDPGFSTKAGSPGLGLSVCKKIVEQHGGSIAVKSRPAQGTTFSIFLPLPVVQGNPS
jgi:nitrogen fixation/metabolism regulation signal transduction histidine kinase